MKNLTIDNVLEFIGLTEKPFNEMLDAHIAYFSEPDRDKQKLYRALYVYKESQYNKKEGEIWKMIFQK